MHFYGMKRWFDIGTQPKDSKGLCSDKLKKQINEELGTRFYDVVFYDRQLSDKEIYDFELKPLNNVHAIKEFY